MIHGICVCIVIVHTFTPYFLGVNYNINRAERSISGRLGLSQTKLNITSQPFNEFTTVIAGVPLL
jgi:hypothetical protein